MKHYLNTMTGHGPFHRSKDANNPNILFISTDMVPTEFYTDPNVRIPNIRAIAKHLNFTNAFATSPLCSPSRAAYLSGRHTYITTNSERAHDGHDIHVRPSDILFPEYLKASGYHMRHIGKSHVGMHKLIDIFTENDAPWDRWSPPWYDDDAYIQYLKSKNLDRITFKKEIAGRDLIGKNKGNSYGGWVADQNDKPFPQDATYPAFLVNRTIEALESRSDTDQPFYLQLDFFGPHQPFAIPTGLEEREKEIRETMQLPESYQTLHRNDLKADMPEPRVYSIYRRNWGLYDPETVLDYRVANQLQFELIDTMIGHLFDHLKEQNLYDNTWILFIADHGEMNGENALIDKGAYLNPRVLRVPLFIKPSSDANQAQQTIDTPVSLLDIAPTVLDIAGIQTDARLDGISLLQTDEPRPDDKPILADVWSHVIPNPCVGTVFSASDGENYLITFNASDPEDELYRLSDGLNPPNRWRDEAFKTIRHEALNLLHARLSADERWKSYKGFLEITYPHQITEISGDRQLFV